MKAKLPIIGQVRTGKDAIDVPVTATSLVPAQTNLEDKAKFFDVLGGILEMSGNNLSTEKSVSNKLLKANREWVYRNNDVIAKEVGKIDFELFQVGLKGGEIVYTEVEEHPLLVLLDKFNLTTTKTDGIYNTQSHKKLTGDAFWLLRRNGSQIEEIFLLQPDKVELKLGDPTQSEPLVKAYVYKDIVDGKSMEITYQPEDIIHFKTPNPDNPYRGKGAVEAMAETIDSDNLANRTQKNFFKNGAITNFVLTTDNKITDEQLKRLKADLKANNAGVEKAFQAMVLSGGLKPASIGYSNKDLQLIDLLTWYRDKIMVEFGNTPASLGIIEDVNQANAKDTLAAWKRGTIKPDMDAIVNTLNEFLVPLFGKNLILGYVDPVPEDRTDDLDEAVQLKQAGIITVNEARTFLGYETIQGGDVLSAQNTAPQVGAPSESKPQVSSDEEELPSKRRNYRQSGRVHDKKLGNIPAALAHLDVKTILRRKGMFTELKYNKDLKEAVKPVIKELLAKGKTKEEALAEAMEERITPHFTNEVIMAFYDKQVKAVKTVEDSFEKAIVKFIKELEDQALQNFDSQLKDKSTRSIKSYIKKQQLELFDDEAIKTQAQIDLTPILMNQVVIAGQAAYELIGHEDVYIPFNVGKVVADNVEKFTQSMLDTDRDSLNLLITNGVEQGLGIPEIRSSITSKFEDISKNQSTRITRTEVMRASNMGNLDAYKQSGIVEGKQWLAAGADDDCAAYDGETTTLEAGFYSSDSEFQDGDPPLHPNCKCVIIPIVTASGKPPEDAEEFADDQVVD